MTLDDARQRYVKYFTEKIEKFGASPQGVDYNSSTAQEIRFEQLVKVIRPENPFSVIDYGCGYGALFDFMNQKNWRFDYYGFDIIEKMIIAGREAHRDAPDVHFTTNEDELPIADYLLAGAIFNNKFQSDSAEWTQMVRETLVRMDKLCTKGFSFNMLTSYSDTDRMAQRRDLYFGDPLFFFDFCKRNFSRNVALLHDYGLYDFTILVRKDVA
jgi:SAM-dependent methyltransferase